MYYSLFNLTFNSQFPLYNIPTTSNVSAQSITINKVDTLNIDVASMQQVGAYCWVNANEFLLKVPKLAQFYVHGGNIIEVKLFDEADVGLLNYYLQGYMLAILMQQRKHLVLHGTVLQRQGVAIAICGVSGIGKTTLGASLIQQGWSLVSDDLCVFDTDGRVMQGASDLKIWPDVAETLLLENAVPFSDSLTKLQLNTNVNNSSGTSYINDYFPLSAIFCLTEAVAESTIKQYKGMHKFAPLKSNSYRPQFMKAMGQDALFMQHCSSFLSHTPVYSLCRTQGKLSSDKLNHLTSILTRSLEGNSEL